MKKTLYIFSVTLLMFVFVTSAFKVGDSTANAETLVDSGIDYTESLSEAKNPDRGFLRMFYVDVKQETQSGIEQTKLEETINGKANPTAGYDIDGGTKQILICFGLEEYSSKMGGQDRELSENSLDCIRNTLEAVRLSGETTIVRFSYDLHGDSYDNKTDCEPELSLVLKHVKQICPIVNDYVDVITAIETGMFGPWGEQHSTTLGDDENISGYYQLINTWLENTNKDLYLLVRRPKYFLHWYNTKYNKSYTTANIDTIEIIKDSASARIGGYNDGYLGSKSDWGTYTNRTQEIKWLQNTMFVPFGGEVLQDSEKDTSKNPNGIGTYNCVSYIENEAFITHTSFLNYAYNYENVIKFWEQNQYMGNDQLYKNKTTEFEYVRNHLGYRLVLRKSEIQGKVNEGEKLQFSGKIENVGFGNVTRKQNVYALVVNNNNEIVMAEKTNIDCRAFLSSKGNVNYSTDITLNTNVTSGQYKLYLKIISAYEAENSNARTIMLANNNIYNETLKANYIGSFSVEKAQASASSSSNHSENSNSVSTSSESDGTNADKTSDDNSNSSVSSQTDELLASAKIAKKTGCSASLGGGNMLLFCCALIALVCLIMKGKKKI